MGCHYTTLYLSILYCTILYIICTCLYYTIVSVEVASPALSRTWIWHPHLAIVYYSIKCNTILYYTLLYQGGGASPSLHHGRAWIRLRMSSPPLYKWGCHYTIPLYYAVLYYNILYSDAILYSQWRWHPNLSQEGGFGTPISLYSTVLDYTLLYYTILSFTKVEVVSPSLHHGRVWIRVRSSSPPINCGCLG
jgi:hypothetical protein